MTQIYYKEQGFGDMVSTFRNEIVYYINPKNDNAYVEPNRSLVRNYVNYIEASVNYIGYFILNEFKEKKFNLSEGELFMLRGVAYSLSEGIVKERPLLLSLPDNFRFTYSLFARVHDRQPVFQTYIQDHFHGLKEIIKVRNRFTHPRQAEDSLVDNKERDVTIASYNHYYDFQMALFKDYLYDEREI
jgi:hypothetical protein